MVADAARLAHAAGREDDLRHAVRVDHAGFLAGHADPQPRESDGVDALLQHGGETLLLTHNGTEFHLTIDGQNADSLLLQ